MNASQVFQLARGAGFDPATAVIMTAISGAESSWNPDAVGDVGLEDATWGPSVGLWQIRSLKAQSGTGGPRDVTRLTDPAFNASAAYAIYRGQGLSAWSTYTSGAYESYLSQATAGGSSTSTTTAGSNGSTGAGGDVQAAIAFATAQIGKPYVWGATGPNSWDCSSLVQAAWRAGGVSLGRTTYQQILQGRSVAAADLQPGDLVFTDPGHVQLYIGGGRIIEAAHTGVPVRFSNVSTVFAARRVDGSASSSGTTASNALDLTSIPGVGDIAGALNGVWSGVQNYGLHILVAGAGIALVVAGAVVAAQPAAKRAASTAAQAAPLAAAL